jgi:hypothetical protein
VTRLPGNKARVTGKVNVGIYKAYDFDVTKQFKGVSLAPLSYAQAYGLTKDFQIKGQGEYSVDQTVQY